MKMARNRDLYAGIFFMLFGLFFVLESVLRLPIGTAYRMGPGYFPLVLGLILMGMGVVIALGREPPGDDPGPMISLRALVLLSSAPMIFGLTIDRFGFVPATFAAVFVATIADRDVRIVSVLISSLAITAFCVGVFIYGLGMPYRLFRF
jgi:vacuolar-type H+-ATPase subunit I/STV1